MKNIAEQIPGYSYANTLPSLMNTEEPSFERRLTPE